MCERASSPMPWPGSATPTSTRPRPPAGGAAPADAQLPAFGHGLDGVDAEIPDRLPDLLGIGAHGERVGVLPGQREAVGQAPVLDQQEDVVEQRDEVDLDQRERGGPGVLEEARDAPVQPLRLAQDDLDEAPL